MMIRNIKGFWRSARIHLIFEKKNENTHSNTPHFYSSRNKLENKKEINIFNNVIASNT